MLFPSYVMTHIQSVVQLFLLSSFRSLRQPMSQSSVLCSTWRGNLTSECQMANERFICVSCVEHHSAQYGRCRLQKKGADVVLSQHINQHNKDKNIIIEKISYVNTAKVERLHPSICTRVMYYPRLYKVANPLTPRFRSPPTYGNGCQSYLLKCQLSINSHVEMSKNRWTLVDVTHTQKDGFIYLSLVDLNLSINT